VVVRVLRISKSVIAAHKCLTPMQDIIAFYLSMQAVSIGLFCNARI